MRLFIKSFHESSHKEWNIFMWVLDTLYSLLRNWLRDHTSWASSGIGVKIKSLPKNFWSLVLNFTAPRYAFLFSNSETYVAHVIIFYWSRSVFFFRCTHLFFQQVPTRPVIENSKKIAKKLKKLKTIIVASFQAKTGLECPKKSENKNYRSDHFLPNL